MKKIKPVRNLIVVKVIKDEIKSKGGVILPGAGDTTFIKGIVKAVNDNEKELKEGDKIIFLKAGSMETDEYTDPHRLVKSGNIVAIIDDPDNTIICE